MLKKIIFISNGVGSGGAGRVISVLANSFIKRGFDVTICSYKNNFKEYELNKMIHINYITSKFKNKILLRLDRFIQLWRIIHKNSNCIIIAFEYFINMQTILAALGSRNKVIISERNDPNQQNNRKVIKHMRNLLYTMADVLVCQTQDAKSYFPKQVQKKAVIIPNPLKEDLPAPYHGIRKKEVVNFCRLENQKNLKLLIDAFEMLHREYPEYVLSIYGNGREKVNLQAYISEKQVGNYVYLYDDTQDIHSRILDCYMFVSSSDYEGISNSMLEAMAIGLPCIVTDCPCGGAKMFIKSGKNGLLVPTNDANALYGKMKDLVEYPLLAQKISKNAIDINNKLCISKIMEEWIKLF